MIHIKFKVLFLINDRTPAAMTPQVCVIPDDS